MESILGALPTAVMFLAVAVGVPLLGVIVASFIDMARSKNLRAKLGIAALHPGLFGLLVILYGTLVLLLFVGLCLLIVGTVGMGLDMERDPENLRTEYLLNLSAEYLFYVLRIAGLTTVLGAVIALPLTVIRLRLQTDANITAQEGLITDRINKAIEQLGHDSPAVRMGAILQLERILRDSLQDRVLVLDTLNAYVVHKQKKKSGSKTKVVNPPIDVQAALDVMFRQRVE